MLMTPASQSASGQSSSRLPGWLTACQLAVCWRLVNRRSRFLIISELFNRHFSVFDDDIERFLIAQPVFDTSQPPFLCQAGTHRLYRLTRGRSQTHYFSINFCWRDLDLFGIRNISDDNRGAHIAHGMQAFLGSPLIPIDLSG